LRPQHWLFAGSLRVLIRYIDDGEVPQAFFGDFAAVIGVKIVELSSGVRLMPSTR
jgi:hypothetical protein